MVDPQDGTFIRSDYDQDLPGIVTYLVGRIGPKEVQEWAETFQECRDRNFFNQGFKLLVNTYGYEPESVEVHKQWRSALVTYCENRCIAVAFVNHDPVKVSELQKTASQTHNFFVDAEDAYEWLQQRTSASTSLRQ